MKTTAQEELTELWAGFGKFVGTILLAPFAVAARTFVVRSAWGWFLGPVTGQEPPPYWVVYGLLLLIRFAFHQRRPKNTNDKEESAVVGLFSSLVLSAVFYGFGWAVVTVGPWLGY